MRFKLLLVCWAVIYGFLLSALPAAASPAAVSVIAPQDSRLLLTDGQYVVWSAPQTTGTTVTRTIFAALLLNPEVKIIAGGLPVVDTDQPLDYALDAGVVVWVEGQGQHRTLRARQLAKQEMWTVATGDVSRPAIAGDVVTWWERIDPRYAQGPEQVSARLMARNFRSGAAAVELAQTPNTIYRFGSSKMSNGWVVWSQATTACYAVESWQLFAVPATGGRPRIVGDGSCGGNNFDLAGDQVVFFNSRSAGRPQTETPNGIVEIKNLRTGAAMTTDGRGVGRLTTDGRYVFWGKQRGEAAQLYLDVWGYDPQSDSAFVVSTGTEPIGASAVYDLQPSAKAGTLTWFGNNGTNRSTIQVVAVKDVLPSAPRPAPPTPRADQLFFVETGHTLAAGFRSFWERSGGLPVFGYPLTEEYIETNADLRQGFTTQYLERQRFEFHPENQGTPYEVLLGRLGNEALLRQGRNWQTFPKADPRAPHYYPQTGHAIATQFWDYWRTHGLELGDTGVTEREALALWGYPLSEPMTETNSSGDTVLTQWFERARFEYHPNNPEQSRVLLGRLAADALVERGW